MLNYHIKAFVYLKDFVHMEKVLLIRINSRVFKMMNVKRDEFNSVFFFENLSIKNHVNQE